MLFQERRQRPEKDATIAAGDRIAGATGAGDMGAIAVFLPVAATTCCTWAPWALRALVLLATAVLLLFVQIEATTTKEAMGAEDYVRPTMLDVGVGVARPSMRCAAVDGRTVCARRGGRPPC